MKTFREYLTENQDYVWHGSMHKIDGPLEPRQAHDVGGHEGSNKKAVYATKDKKIATIIPMADEDAFLGMNHEPGKPVQGILYSGSLRHGGKIYLYKLPADTFEDAGSGAGEVISYEPVMPVGVEVVNVDDYLHLIRKPTKEDWEFRRKHDKEMK